MQTEEKCWTVVLRTEEAGMKGSSHPFPAMPPAAGLPKRARQRLGLLPSSTKTKEQDLYDASKRLISDPSEVPNRPSMFAGDALDLPPGSVDLLFPRCELKLCSLALVAQLAVIQFNHPEARFTLSLLASVSGGRRRGGCKLRSGK